MYDESHDDSQDGPDSFERAVWFGLAIVFGLWTVIALLVNRPLAALAFIGALLLCLRAWRGRWPG